MDSFAALADPTRRHILESLARGPLSSGEIAAQFEITAPAISQHLKALRAAKLVRARAQGQRRIYSLNPEGIEELGGWIDQLRQFWAGKFDALDTALRSAPEQDVKQLDTGDGNERKG
ncbi:metalloregulator ArsR/SmtB family transcription factor [Rhodoligotrophos ferricapiens]|uniref:metalloregulator ArsR/SmtB family transcription factor n=1 Tax=Rhodoligotrophos ferricapiens TaxID=3069264 RepID=UPI00315C9A66